jgi:hypothetical protein
MTDFDAGTANSESCSSREVRPSNSDLYTRAGLAACRVKSIFTGTPFLAGRAKPLPVKNR